MKARTFLIFFCYFSSSCDSSIYKEDPLFVSLGSYCDVSFMLEACDQRKEAFPFDWIFSLDGEGLIRLLEEDFKHFFDVEFYISKKNGTFAHRHYKLEFPHDEFPYERSFPKYLRRVQRFRDLNSYPGKVIFIRYAYAFSYRGLFFTYDLNLDIEDDYSLRLYETLEKYFPTLNFTLIILNTHQRSNIEFGFEGELRPKLLKYSVNPFIKAKSKMKQLNVFFNDLIQYSYNH